MTQKRTFLFALLAAGLFYTHPTRAQEIGTFAGNGFGASTGVGGYTGDGGQANKAELNSCTGIALDGAGNLYIADRGNNVVRKVNTFGIISTFAGTDSAGYSGDGGQATKARLNKPYGVATDVAGNVYISDYGNHVIRIVSPTGIINTFAGSGIAGNSGDGSNAKLARLSTPEGITVDSFGTLYITDFTNNVVRAIGLSDTVIYTFAGTGSLGYGGDGSDAALAQLHGPAGVAADIYGNVYIADYYNNAVRRVDRSGTISTFAGNGLAYYGGDGGPAAAAGLHYPSGVAVYGFGNVYIADQNNNAVRVVSTAGTISTLAGTGTNGYTGDGGPSTVAEISSPKAIIVDALQRVFVADYDNNVVRVIYSNIPAGVHTINAAGALSVYPNPSNGSFTIDLPASNVNAIVTITDVLGRCVETRNIAAPVSSSALNFNVPAGSYMVKVTEGDKSYKAQVSVIK